MNLMHWSTTAVAALALTSACDRPRPSSSTPAGSGMGAQSAPRSEAPLRVASSEPAATTTAESRPSCLRPMATAAPTPAARAQQCPEDPTGKLDLSTVVVSFPDAPGTPRVLAEHADSDAARERGLMYRTEMPADGGMLFSWSNSRPRSFWMKNTCLPLDMLFIDADGVIVSVQEQVPTLNLAPRSSGCPARRVLEVHAGWTRAHGVRPGQTVQIEE